MANARRTDWGLAAYLIMVILCVELDHGIKFAPGIWRVESEVFCPILILALIMSSTRDGGMQTGSFHSELLGLDVETFPGLTYY